MARPSPGPSRKRALKLDRRTLALLGLQWLVFVGNLAAAWLLAWPAWLHVLIGFLPVHVAFTVWHEAAHGTVSNIRGVNHVVGVLGMLPYMTPYFLQRHVHLEHHRFLNEPGRDPNELYAGGPFWQMPLRYLQLAGHARRVIRGDPRTLAMRVSDAATVVLVLSVYAFAAWHGRIVALAFAWLVPAVIAKVVMDWYINYLPHVGLPPDRWRGTRIVDVPWLTPLVFAHNYHAIHHLWPAIPWHGYLAQFSARHDELLQHGVPIEHRVFAARAGAGGG